MKLYTSFSFLLSCLFASTRLMALPLDEVGSLAVVYVNPLVKIYSFNGRGDIVDPG